MNIYLDIDGVLMTKDKRPAVDVVEFLKHVTENHNVFWLTTHCKGDVAPALRHLDNILPEEAGQYLEKIKPTNWQTLKTEAIDFEKDFLWLDDYAMEAEKEVLRRNNALDKVVLIDPRKRASLMEKLKQVYPVKLPQAMFTWGVLKW